MMDLMLNIPVKPLPKLINYQDKIMLVGSCFTEHIGNALEEAKFSVLQNPHGILFDTLSVCRSLHSYIVNRQYQEEDLFLLNEVWNSWDHHSRFSNMDKQECLKNINTSQSRAHDFLKKSNWLIITLGSSFSYQLSSVDVPGENNQGVANCHRAPAQWFNKKLLGIDESIHALEECCARLNEFNPLLNIIFTISPVRHIRDGVVENNRSKARLIEASHTIINNHEHTHYFPAYEIVIDVLRDYRFYDIDLVHPNYTATAFVMEKFVTTCIDPTTAQLMEDIKKIIIARKHKAFQPGTIAHRDFLSSHADKIRSLIKQHPFLDLQNELKYFES